MGGDSVSSESSGNSGGRVCVSSSGSGSGGSGSGGRYEFCNFCLSMLEILLE